MKKYHLQLYSLALIIILTVLLCQQVGTVRAENKTDNTRYEMLHIKHKARMQSDNNRVKYVYQKGAVQQTANEPTEIGTTRLSKNNTIRELHIAVDLSYNNRLGRINRNNKITISIITGNTKTLKKVNLVIHSNKTLKFD